jgi:methyl-accepting chemotaxis protein
MQAVRDSSSQVSEAIRSLGAKSDEIGGIVATITGIAAQTNLLALNAAIEAARAGEHGRGFAVVAEEVRHLAEESQQAAATIGSLIEQIQHETARAVEVVELGATQTRDGVETVEQTREVFLRIGQSVEDMSARAEQIAAAIRQIAVASDEVRDSMETVASVAEQSSASTQQVSASTEQSSASTQQIAASAQQLAGTADELDRLVSQFTLA